MRILYIIILGLIAHMTGLAQPARTISSHRLHEGFIKNEGQFVDEQGNVNNDVRFMHDAKNFHLQLKQAGFSYEWISAYKDPVNQSESERLSSYADEMDQETHITAHRVDVVFIGANKKPVIVASEKSGYSFNYYLPGIDERGIQNAVSYNRVTFQNLYDGIDLVFSYNHADPVSPVMYSFTIHPGASASKIKMQYQGAKGISVDDKGELKAFTDLGDVQEKALRCFIKKNSHPLQITRTVKNGIVQFHAPFSADETVIIDPNIVWSSYYGGSNTEYANDVDIDNQEKVIMVGYTESSSNIATSGAHQSTWGGGLDMFVAKFKTDGGLEWATYLGGTKNEIAYSVATDNKNIVVSGRSRSSTDITTTGAFQETNFGSDDCILAKFNKSGILLWCTLLGGPKTEQFRQVIVEKGKIYVCGYTESGFNVKVSNKNPSVYSGGDGDAFFGKFSSSGFPSWTAYYGGNGIDRGHGIALDQFGNIFIEGTTESDSGFATASAFQTVYGGEKDAFVSRFDSTGNLIWGTYYGGDEDDHGRGVVCDKKSNIYITGYCASAGIFGTPGTYQPNINSHVFEGFGMDPIEIGDHHLDGFLSRFDYNGNRIWGTYYGGESGDELLCIERSDSGYIFVAGGATSNDSICTVNGFQQFMHSDSSDGYFGKFDTLGNLLYGSYFGGAGIEEIEGMVYKDNSLYFAVATTGGLPVTQGVWQTSYAGVQDGMVTRFNLGNCFDQYEPNETQSVSTQLIGSTDTSLYGNTASISSSNDIDWFKVKIKAPKPNLKVILTDLTKNYSLKFYNSSGNFLSSSIADGSDQVLISNGLAEATYYLQVVPAPGEFDIENCYRVITNISNNPFSALANKEFSIRNENKDLNISIYPNPTSREIYVSGFMTQSESVSISLFNSMQQKVFHAPLHLSGGRVMERLELPDLSAGVYLFEWNQRDVIHHEKIIIR